MNVKSCFIVKSYHLKPSLVLLVIRLVAGIAMVLHGWGKIQNPMGWMGPDSPVPGVFQMLAAVAEFGGGIAWALGLLFPLASLGILCTMIVATARHMFVMGDPFVGSGSSYELAALYLCLSLLFLAFGPGNYSVDKKLF